MIFTDRFVYVHEPKPGGRSSTSVLLRLYACAGRNLLSAQRLFGEVRRRHPRYGALVHNSTARRLHEIPVRMRRRRSSPTVRNPFDLYVSQYDFGWWRRAEFRRYYEAAPGFPLEYPGFPDLTSPTMSNSERRAPAPLRRRAARNG